MTCCSTRNILHVVNSRVVMVICWVSLLEYNIRWLELLHILTMYNYLASLIWQHSDGGTCQLYWYGYLALYSLLHCDPVVSKRWGLLRISLGLCLWNITCLLLQPRETPSVLKCVSCFLSALYGESHTPTDVSSLPYSCSPSAFLATLCTRSAEMT